MSVKAKIILTFTIIILIIIVGLKIISNWTKAIMEDKPIGPYHSSITIDQAKKDNVWIGTYLSDSAKFYSSDKSDAFVISEIWIEKNNNDKEIYLYESKFENILSIYFKSLTEKDLHKFRLIPFPSNESGHIENPDGYPRIRFLLNGINDTIKIEVLERNPTDSIAWTTKKIIDTITLIKKN
jgi:hypothetical protein